MEILRNQEEVDTRLILHVFDVCRKGYKKLTILGSDTDIAVFALYHFYGLILRNFGIRRNTALVSTKGGYQYMNIHCLGEEICRVLPFWYATSDCDAVSTFSGRGKKTIWNVGSVFEETTRSFII